MHDSFNKIKLKIYDIKIIKIKKFLSIYIKKIKS